MTKARHENRLQTLLVPSISVVVFLCIAAFTPATGAEDGPRALTLRFEVSGGTFRLRGAKVYDVQAPPTLHNFGPYGLTVQLRDGSDKTLSELHIWDPRRGRSESVVSAGGSVEGGITAPIDTTFALSVPLSCALRSVKFVEADAVVDVSGAVAEACGKKKVGK